MKERIAEARKYLGLSQTKLAEKLGVTRSTVCAWESGRNKPTDALAKFFCEQFGISKEWLTSGQGNMLSVKDDEFIIMSAKIEKDGDAFLKELTKTLWALDKEELLVLKSIINKIKNNPNL